MSVLCVAGQTHELEFSLDDQANTGLFKVAPTIAPGDFQISVNGGAFENVDNIPTVTPAAGRRVALVISAAETTAAAAGGLIYIQGVDAAGSEWYDVAFSVRVLAVADKTGYKLASDGLDQISAAEPTAKPTTFAGWIMWLVQRFRRSTLTATALTVTKEDATAVTEQTVSDDGTTQTLGAPS